MSILTTPFVSEYQQHTTNTKNDANQQIYVAVMDAAARIALN